MQTVLVAIDGSPLGDRALAYALDLYPDAAITVLHVVDPVEAVYLAEAKGPSEGRSYVEAAREHGAELCDRAEAVAADRGIAVDTAVETGNPAREILRFIDANDVDAVVMGSHGRSGLSRVFLGSVAETVLRRSPVPVTVVR
ncbi:universal stress protein [Haloarchaeobius amylolyticus]|uniref:universal stress protein n=1 Tax=Haloarchaeobius amylolyticus TaxID=1198296 RepID=UPI00226FFBEC|nr:universal stress protein [Haloarchaeobius amylolyticus]